MARNPDAEAPAHDMSFYDRAPYPADPPAPLDDDDSPAEAACLEIVEGDLEGDLQGSRTYGHVDHPHVV